MEYNRPGTKKPPFYVEKYVCTEKKLKKKKSLLRAPNFSSFYNLSKLFLNYIILFKIYIIKQFKLIE